MQAGDDNMYTNIYMYSDTMRINTIFNVQARDKNDSAAFQWKCDNSCIQLQRQLVTNSKWQMPTMIHSDTYSTKSVHVLN